MTTASSASLPQTRYDDDIVRLFMIAAAFWGVVGFLAVVYIAAELAWAVFNLGGYVNFEVLRPVLTSASRTGTGSGAALLFDGVRGPVPIALEPVSVAPERAGRLAAYAERWRSQCAAAPVPPPARRK